MGRVFCGMFCPVGSMIDFIDRIFRGMPKVKQTFRPSIKFQKMKYVFLLSLLFLSLFGVTFPLFMDPLCMIPRLFGEILKPGLFVILNTLHIGGDSIAKSNTILKGSYEGTVTTFVLFAIIIFGSIIDRRFWCQYICPSGAFFGLLSRFTLFERKINNKKCNECGVCSMKSCAVRAISGKEFEKTNKAECIVCGVCTADKKNCSSFGFTGPDTVNSVSTDLNRRQLSTALVTGFLFLPTLTSKDPRRSPFIPSPIRPPGAIDELQFQAKCITCGACISICPEKALQPCNIVENRFFNWNTPKLVPRTGYCEENCIKCAQACPTGALIPFTVKQKSGIKIGTSVVNRSLCRPWRQQASCGICIVNCPYGAINQGVIEVGNYNWAVPVVNIKHCTGCGKCEHLCPADGEAAIKVFSNGEIRSKREKI
jgi:MauM/NapG family ferredoxin protein